MDSLAGIFAGSFVIALSGAMMPGPMFVAVVGQSPRRGPGTGPVMVLGHSVLECALVGAVILGLANVLSHPDVLAGVALSGGALLLWMAAGMLRGAGGMTLLPDSGPRRKGGLVEMHPFWAGILTSVTNPYWILWWATVGFGYLLISRQLGFPGLSAFLAGHLLADLVWFTLVSVLVAGGKSWLTDRLYRGMIRVCAVVLVLFAFYFGWHGFNGISV